MGAKVEPLRPKLKCPECGKESKREFFPFCCQRCKDIDLNRWLSGAYAIPVTEAEENLDEE
ncbi:DNA gyrase inhibitor YacG [Oricola thermophila]|uniref:DNA gyrase inhibitor YacG n=1 Tax=Oricola thermophila TaxID=2742145 RepID=A0A6N1V8F6_9HYPH|nr:DNA gyrase inhibitor YacG [Oricola thermophila]QKV17194.1 DNA gyrase inhibitor YacG [Oricola thermophila]